MNDDSEFGYVYACHNKSFPGKYKIGQTKNLERRMHDFNNTAIPEGNPTLLDFAVGLQNLKPDHSGEVRSPAPEFTKTTCPLAIRSAGSSMRVSSAGAIRLT